MSKNIKKFEMSYFSTHSNQKTNRTHCGVVCRITRIATKQKHDFCPLGGEGASSFQALAKD